MDKKVSLYLVLILSFVSILLGGVLESKFSFVEHYSGTNFVSIPTTAEEILNNQTRLTFDFLKLLNLKSETPVKSKVNSGSLITEKDLEEITTIINNKFYSLSGSIDKKKLEDSVFKGLASGLGDEHSVYFNKEESSKFADVMQGNFEGIGISVTKAQSGGILVNKIFDGAPAKLAGLKENDVIISADGKDLTKLPLEEAIAKVKGPKNTFVNLDLLRQGNIIKDVKVKREKIAVPTLEGKVLDLKDNKIGYIQMDIFGANSEREFNKSLDSFKKENITGLIIDLRNNGGGYLESAVGILSRFFKFGDSVVLMKEGSEDKGSALYSYGNDSFYQNIPLVILINENSASASEITAGALQEKGQAILVGMKSYGKGSAQEIYPLSNGGEIKLTVARWFTPGGKQIDKIGLTPDVQKDLTFEDMLKGKDLQLDSAKDVILEFIKVKDKNKVIELFSKDNSKPVSPTK